MPGRPLAPPGAVLGRARRRDHRPLSVPRYQSPALTPHGVLFPVGAEQRYFVEKVRVFAAREQPTEGRGSG